ncbi:hypothetical protein ARMGADRAFT_1068830 [Armillaria gallica]|uniref:Mid2 domain-containing protein n=1 Tax=Armillaria gallica TaxID=47427 RepID=A0A2H3CH58_ARMGA|nr:hypothetical protein ARMGADRAFT_1068830 [Armillaria gallica]
MLLHIALSFLQFAISRAFHFDKFTGTLAVGIPITLFWHHGVSDPSQIEFVLVSLPTSFQGIKLFSNSDITQPDGTLNVIFPGTGDYTVKAFTNQTGYAAVLTTQTFEVLPPSENGGSDNSTVPLSAVQSASVVSSGTYDTTSLHSVELSSSASTESVRSTATASPNSNSHRNHKTSIIIGTVLGSLVSLLLLIGCTTFMFMRQRKERNLNCRLLEPDPMIISENLHSPPPREKNSETVSRMLVGETMPNLQDRSCETVEEVPTDDGRERINSVGNPLASDPHGAQQQAPLDVMAAVVRSMNQLVQLFINREAQRARRNSLDSPPEYE